MNARFLTLRVLLMGLCGVMASTDLAAQNNSKDIEIFAQNLPETVKQRMSRNVDGFLQQMTREIFQIAPDGSVSKDAIKVFGLRRNANMRNQFYLKLLAFDLDGDGQISAEEVALQNPFLNPNQRSELALNLVQHDTNKDGTLSADEMTAAYKKFRAENENRRRMSSAQDILAFDFDTNGTVTIDEVAKVFAAVKPEDLKRKNRTSLRNPIREKNCVAPKPEANQEVAFLSGYEGAALSTIALAGQDKQTTVGTVRIAPGDTPLYIFATAHAPIIWKFEGATKRVKQLVIQSRKLEGKYQAGAAGIDKKVVSFVPDRSCIDSYVFDNDPEGKKNIAALSDNLNRPFDHVIYRYSIKELQIPVDVGAGMIAELAKPYLKITPFVLGFKAYTLSSTGMRVDGATNMSMDDARSMMPTMRSMMRFYPGGLVPFDPKEVVASHPVVHYTILPQEAGLLQLLAEKKISVVERGTYLIEKPIDRFPGNLSGAHSVRFILKDGVPMPEGKPSHSRVVAEKTGECLAGSECR